MSSGDGTRALTLVEEAKKDIDALKPRVDEHAQFVAKVKWALWVVAAGVALSGIGGTALYSGLQSVRSDLDQALEEVTVAGANAKKSLDEIVADAKRDIEATRARILDEAIGAARAIMAEQVPVGSVAAYAGSLKSDADKSAIQAQGWLLCNGRALEKEGAYARLFAVIGTCHGDGTTQNGSALASPKDFNLPDYRGLFLRGVDHGRHKDPDAGDRDAAAEGGASKDHVGSFQEHALRRHRHSYAQAPSPPKNNTREGPHHASSQVFVTSARSTGWEGLSSDETRPSNAYVNWLIRFRDP